MKDGRPAGDEDLAFPGTTHYMRIRTNEAVVADAQRVACRAPQNSVLHDDALSADRDRPALGDDLSPVHDSTARADGHIAANNGIRCNVGGGIDLGRGAGMLDEHVILPGMVSRNPTGFRADLPWLGSRAGAGLFRAQLDKPSLVAISPLAQLLEDRLQAAPPRREIVFHARRDLGIHRATDQPVFLELAQLQREHPLGDVGEQPPQLAEPLGSRRKVEEAPSLPSSADHSQRRFHRAPCPRVVAAAAHRLELLGTLFDTTTQICAYLRTGPLPSTPRVG